MTSQDQTRSYGTEEIFLLTMGVTITSNDNRLLACPIAHSTETARRVFVSNIIGVNNVKPLLQIHTRAEGFFACLEGRISLGGLRD